MPIRGSTLTAAVATAGVVGGAYFAYNIYKEYQEAKLPKVWHEVGTLKDLYVYPIKSCGPILLNKVECTTLGLKDGWLRDRVLMVVDEKNNFITARAYPHLLLVNPLVRNSILTLNYDGMETLHVNLAEVIALQKPQQAQVWGVNVPIYDCGREASEWFSRLLNKTAASFKLVYYASQDSRDLRGPKDKFFKITKKDTGAFPDEVSYNLINEASVDDLNTRLNKGSQVSPRNFRPNFVLTGAKAYEEDNWKFIKIGNNVFEIIKPCTRCILTTIDPETGVHNAKTEPLEMLKTYRQFENPEIRRSVGTSPRMGLQMALRSKPGNTISLNDTIYAA
ncbi:mitochondrial amidoxime reducing component 2 [Melitaea cinxia]|uniref:mitochondrial amidoxime reducing component 2 n=1 Tax=Melitaea cinxia TaxID=113334 RepID=UPI001E273139|nr:mitochondrial amidoxime reducing component 2 [Melitaea cinxia]